MLKIESNDRISLIPTMSIISVNHDDGGNTCIRVARIGKKFEYVDNDLKIFNQVKDGMCKRVSVIVDVNMVFDVYFFQTFELIGDVVEALEHTKRPGSGEVGIMIPCKSRQDALDLFNKIHAKR